MPWTTILDDIAVSDGGSSDHTYASVVVLKGFDGVSFTVGGASRIPYGIDIDDVSDWVRNDFDEEGLPGYSGSPGENEAFNTPEAENEPVPPEIIEVTIMGGVWYAHYRNRSKVSDPISGGDQNRP